MDLKVGNVIRFKGSDDLYKIIYQEETGEFLARFAGMMQDVVLNLGVYQ